MIDYALRRRFSFFEMEPGFNSDGFTEYQKAFSNETFDALIDQIKALNKEILLYAKTDESITPDCMFNLGGNRIGARTLDLNTDFKVIAAQLDQIVKEFFENAG